MVCTAATAWWLQGSLGNCLSRSNPCSGGVGWWYRTTEGCWASSVYGRERDAHPSRGKRSPQFWYWPQKCWCLRTSHVTQIVLFLVHEQASSTFSFFDVKCFFLLSAFNSKDWQGICKYFWSNTTLMREGGSESLTTLTARTAQSRTLSKKKRKKNRFRFFWLKTLR